MNQCQYCKNTFSTIYTLQKHQKITKFCLKLRQTHLDEENVFSKHNKSELLNIISNLKQQLHDSQIQLKIYKEIAEKSKTVNNNTINNKYLLLSPLIISPETLQKQLKKHFNKNNLIDGQKAVADFANSRLLRDKYGNSNFIPKDLSRGLFVYKNKSGEVENDFKAINLVNSLYDPVLQHSEKVYEEAIKPPIDFDKVEIYRKGLTDIRNLKENNDRFVSRLKIMLSIKNMDTDIIFDKDDESYEVCHEISNWLDEFPIETADFILEKLLLYRFT